MSTINFSFGYPVVFHLIFFIDYYEINGVLFLDNEALGGKY